MAPQNRIVPKPAPQPERKAPREAPEHSVPRSSRRLKILTLLLAVCVVAAWLFALIWFAMHVLGTRMPA
jgi:hypothetical protein